MTLKYPIFMRVIFTSFSLVTLSMASQVAIATVYNYPTAGAGTLAAAPQSLSNGDTLNVDSGTFQTPSSSSTAYTVTSTPATTTGTTITVDAGATISYSGTNTAGAAISSIRSDTGTTNSILNLNGTASNGTGLYAVYLTNSNVTPNDVYTINNTGSITGAVITNGIKTFTFNINGAAASVTGTIDLKVTSTGSSTLNITGGANFTPTSSIADISLVTVANLSSLTLNVLTSNIKALTINNGGTATVNYPLAGLSASDGAIINNGTFNIAANITKTGTFTGTGTNIVSEAVSVTTSSYSITNHKAFLTDNLNYGKLSLATAAFSTTNFSVTGGTGYFPGGTYTLVSSPNSMTITNPTIPVPSSTLFLNFNTPVINNVATPKTVKITLDRTPFNSYATNNLTQAIGVDLESIGATTTNSDMMALLNAVEASTNANQVEFSLEQLAPLTTAPIFGLEVQNNTMRQVQLRLAELRDRDTYFAGDIAKDNYLWMRPFGGYANQQPKDDSLGYYGTGGGIAAGFDRNLGANYNVGAAGAYALSHVKDKVNMESRTEIKSYIGMVYGSYNFPDTHYFDWIVAVMANNFNASRVVNINGYYQTATSSYGSQQISFKGLWGREFPAFGFMQLTPLATAQYTFAKQYEYEESGGAATNLSISRTNSNLVQLGLGAKAATPLWVNPSIIIPEIHALAFYNPIIGQQNSVFSFVDGGGQMTSIFDLSRTGLIYGAALTVAVVDKLEIKFNLDFNVQDRFNAYVVYLNMRYSL